MCLRLSSSLPLVNLHLHATSPSPKVITGTWQPELLAAGATVFLIFTSHHLHLSTFKSHFTFIQSYHRFLAFMLLARATVFLTFTSPITFTSVPRSRWPL